MLGYPVSVTQLTNDLLRDLVFYDQSHGGVTFSGGEPLAQPDFLLALLHACREREIHTVLDTSGLASPKFLVKVAALVNLFYYDLKLMDDNKHRHYTGVSNTLILQNLRTLLQEGHAVCVRVPLIPGVNDHEDDLLRLGEFVASLTPTPPVTLLAYHTIGLDKYHRLKRDYDLSHTQPPTDERMAAIGDRLRTYGLQVTTGG
jgi:pyruvate formate lyase activating enzyme